MSDRVKEVLAAALSLRAAIDELDSHDLTGDLTTEVEAAIEHVRDLAQARIVQARIDRFDRVA